MNTERPTITIVTKNGGYQKDRIYQSALPEWEITRKEPSFSEWRIKQDAPHTEARPVYIAEGKAREDAAWVSAVCGLSDVMVSEAQKIKSDRGHMYLYTDSVQFVHQPDGSISIHEKPQGDPVVWAATAPEAMDQSGKTIEIVSALTAIRCDKSGISEPQTVMVRAQASMRPFTREELVEYAKGSGNKIIPDTGGGISLANGGRQFFDTSKPLIISVQDGLGQEPKELLRYETWAHIPDAALRPFICGAFEPAVIRLAEKTRIPPKLV
jgi:predicted house-cleaning NTP pyrophosphatase (Maf/HAM1 superfamily)